MWKNIIGTVILIIPIMVVASPQITFDGVLPINSNYTVSLSLPYAVGISYANKFVYKMTKTVVIPFINKKEKVIVPIKLGSNYIKFTLGSKVIVTDILKINVMSIVQGTIFGYLDSDLKYFLFTSMSYKNYNVTYSSYNSIVSFGMPIGISLKYFPNLSVGLSVQNHDFLFSINPEGIDTIIVLNNYYILCLDTTNEKINLNIQVPLD